MLLALIFLFEAWLWDRLRPVVAAIVDVVPWGRLKEWLAATIERQPPALALLVFAVPVIVLFPLKFLEVWLLTQHRWFAALAVLAFAKLLGLGVTAFVFEATRHKLLQMAWFRTLYEWVMWLRDRAHALVDPIKLQIATALRAMMPATGGRFTKLMGRLRRRRRAPRVPPAG